MENEELRISVALLLSFCVALTFASPARADLPLNAPIQNFRAPTFSPAGHRIRLITGREAQYLNATEIKITDLGITLYADTSAAPILTTLRAPEALVQFEDKKLRASGPSQIEIIHQNLLTLTGQDWTYDHTQQKITINKNVRVTYQASLPELLK